jgi:hypothetical protein
MRESVSKHIEELVKNDEVLTSEEMKAEHNPDIRRKKKKFWNKISHIEKSKRRRKLNES